MMEGNLCWNCKNIVDCNPSTRPRAVCDNYEPLGSIISKETISEWIGVSINQLKYIMQKFGADKVVELLATRGYLVRYETIMEYKRFYFLGKAEC